MTTHRHVAVWLTHPLAAPLAVTAGAGLTLGLLGAIGGQPAAALAVGGLACGVLLRHCRGGGQ